MNEYPSLQEAHDQFWDGQYPMDPQNRSVDTLKADIIKIISHDIQRIHRAEFHSGIPYATTEVLEATLPSTMVNSRATEEGMRIYLIKKRPIRLFRPQPIPSIILSYGQIFYGPPRSMSWETSSRKQRIREFEFELPLGHPDIIGIREDHMGVGIWKNITSNPHGHSALFLLHDALIENEWHGAKK